jgi:hypothetical protein
LSFEARDLTVKLFAADEGHEGLWAMGCAACDTTAAPKPGCKPPSRPACGATSCKAPSQAPCQGPSKKAGAADGLPPASLATLRQQLRDALAPLG